jgi:Domain of unknown function (DUF4160)
VNPAAVDSVVNCQTALSGDGGMMGLMPRISSFYGIVIAMYYRDHHPPHFHAIYAEYEAQIVIETLEPLAGELPARALRLVQEWAGMHRAELEANWAKAEARQPLDTIEPLP